MPEDRLLGVDLTRGLAVLGMFIAHLLTTERVVWSDPDTWSGLADGRSSILFAVLAGVSVGLLTGRTSPPTGPDLLTARLRLLTRAAMLLVLGSILELLVVPVAVILEFYAVLLALCVPLLRWRPRHLFVLAAALVVVVNPLHHMVVLPFVDGATAGGGVLGRLMVTGVYPVLVWIPFVLVGLGLGRLDLTDAMTRVRIAVTGLALAIVGYSAGDMLGVEPFNPYAIPAEPVLDEFGDVADWHTLVPPWHTLLWTEPHSGTPAEVVGSGGFALAVLGLCLLVADRLRWPLLPFIAVGSMPLSAYCAQLVGIAFIADTVIGAPDDGVAHTVTFVVVALVACTAWSLLLGRGPLERVVAAVTAAALRPGLSTQGGARQVPSTPGDPGTDAGGRVRHLEASQTATSAQQS